VVKLPYPVRHEGEDGAMLSKKDVVSIIDEFSRAKDFSEIERLADELGDFSDDRASEALIRRLSDIQVQEDPDVEDAVCSALVKLGLMKKLGNLNFRVLPQNELQDMQRKLVYEEYSMQIPFKYFK
jgi:uncharacterized protein with von Willebrand factor type A (vWA) domain